jgi:PAP2 superfamily
VNVAVSGLGWLPWRWALLIAGALFVVTVVLRAWPRTRSASTSAAEIASLLGLYAAWQYAGSLSLGGLDGAEGAGLWLANAERALGWPSEAALQSAVLGQEWLVRAADVYYASLHVPVFVITLVWVFVFHRPDWPFTRTMVVLLTGSCLLVQYKPVAPPRLIPQLGVVDTAARTGLSVYDAVPGANQFSAMPSVHIAWAAAVALLVVVIGTSPWRWLVVAYPVATTWVVVVTGNHFLVDAVVAVILLAAACLATVAMPSQRPRRLVSRRVGVGPEAVAAE